MRHRRSIPKLGVKPAHRDAILSNMAMSLIDHGQIQTTVSRAKALVPVISKLITQAKRNDVHSRRLAATTIKKRELLKKLFDEIAPEMKDRPGGYTRVIRSGFRKGDGASLAIVQLLVEKKVEEEETDKKAKSGKKTKAKASTKKETKKKEAKAE